MRMVCMVAAAMAAVSCSSFSGGSARNEPGKGATPVRAEAYQEKCEFFESLDFGTRTARTLSGRVWVGPREEVEPLKGVQVAARSVATGALVYALSAADGRYELEVAPGDEYDVWTCMDGFDELRFRLVVDSSSRAGGVDLYVGLSEAPGWRDVVLKPVE